MPDFIGMLVYRNECRMGTPTASIPFLLRLFDCKKRRHYLSIDAKRVKEYEKNSCQKCVRLARGF